MLKKINNAYKYDKSSSFNFTDTTQVPLTNLTNPLSLMPISNDTVSFQPLMEETTTSTVTGTLKPPRATTIPFDLAAEILSKLPVNFLLKFRFTCKSWNSLISNDPKFAKKHLSVSSKRHRLITATCIPSIKFTVISHPLNTLPFNLIFTNYNKVTQHDYSPINRDFHDRFVASCDGILCFKINQHVAILWNPSIGKLRTLPSLETPIEGEKDGYTVYGFGYDPFIDNYKVVSLFYYNLNDCKTVVSVYTLGSSDSWRRIKDFPPLIPYSQQGVFVSGTVNWLAYYDVSEFVRSYVIISLDLGKEMYRDIGHPDYETTQKLSLGVMRDCLCVFSHCASFDDVWLMKEYGNEESWVKLIRLPRFSNRGMYSDNVKILYVFEDDNHVLLLLEERFKMKWAVYDTRNDIIKSAKYQNFSWVESKVYVESLLSP